MYPKYCGSAKLSLLSGSATAHPIEMVWIAVGQKEQDMGYEEG